MIARHTFARRYLCASLSSGTQRRRANDRIPAVKAKLLEGRKGLVVGIANDQSIAWGCARAFRALGAELAVTYLNDKAKPHVEPLARELEAPIFMPLDVSVPGQLEAVFERIGRDMGRARLPGPFDCLFAEGYALQGRVVDVPRDGFLTDDGYLLLVLHPHGASCRAADEKRRDAVHHDLLRQPDGGEELQYHGCRQGGAGERRPLHGRRARTEGHSRACHLARAAGDPGSFRYSRSSTSS